ncbi:arabinofuranan 3-O-arabinosyltransferase [Herbihabitans rhizosphaerae]|uniref:Arabinofuranan 3-O-arabinosyltransferase n=1 Tax=Herbihabitans rhizosphaerae TaxID=1872711 RepID=A0A4Q7L606_9PSEU|nr:alpha-(1->3)-arabinofuranosyltransferase [Herbihabitans rhizosphaerae]RZS44767.1 arabinofuranan 3-O-arabinosyltransferase [Herbihabitans rhizosphaerae]
MVTTWRRLAGLHRDATAWIMLALIVVSLAQRPGKITFDTKLDLAVDPLAFLGRALHLWNPTATAGELQNQAYGYLFPIGPFFALFQGVGVPIWLAQRLWCALLLCLAFYGMLRLARAMGIGSEPARYVGALGYALAPRMLTEIGPLSSEMLPAVALPWVMLPLVRAGVIGSPRRAAGLSALAVLCMGGVNGAMVVMALVLPGLWLLTRRWSREHVKLVLWWVTLVTAACLWWILPLLLLGEYSLPFLNYIESASNTTAPMSLFEVLRGTNQWVAYVVSGTPWWPSGWLLIDNPLLMLVTGLVAAIGLAGLARARLPERRFLVLGVLTGLTLLTIGYVGEMDSPFAESVRQLLDGPLAPLRNVHKFEPVLRLPLMLAFVHGISGTLAWWRNSNTRVTRYATTAIGAVLVLAMAAPAWLGTLRPGPGWDDVPDHWRSAMTWLADTDRDARTLLLPSTGFGEYTWGRTIDEPAQPLARAPWAVRNQIPLGSEGNTRLMDAVDGALADGRGSPGLADLLARSGYRFLLLRNDIDRRSTISPPATVLRAGLASTPGIRLAAGFGPQTTPADQPLVSTVDRSAGPAPAIEVYEIQRDLPRATTTATSDVATVSGGPENLLPLLDSGLLERDRPTVLTGDAETAMGGEHFVTDGLRRRERNVGRVRDGLSQTLTATEAPRQERPQLDVLPFPGAEHQTVAAYRGVRAVTASSSASFADATGGADPSRLPFAAVDRNPSTAWHSSSFTGPSGQWLEMTLDTPRLVDVVNLTLVDDLRVGWPVTRIRIDTDNGSREHAVSQPGVATNYTVAPGLTGRVRVTVLDVAAGRQDGNAGISELFVPGTTPLRALQVPDDVPAAGPTSGPPVSFSFTRGENPRPACYLDGTPRCDATLARQGEEPFGVHRLFHTTREATYRLEATAVPTIGGLNPVGHNGLISSASSQLAGDQTAGPLAAVDGDPATTWIADVNDPRPALHLLWTGEREISDLKIANAPSSNASEPIGVTLISPNGTRRVTLERDGSARFEPLRTDRLEIVVHAAPRTGRQPITPAGIGELRVSTLDDLLRPLGPDTPFTVPCGGGPVIHLDGVRYPTALSGTLADVMGHRPVRLSTCDELSDGVRLPPGDHEVRTESAFSFSVHDLWLTPAGRAPRPVTHRDTTVRTWDATHREVAIGAGPAAVLTVPENANGGWRATLDGRVLEPSRVDGWQQAWLVPEGAGGTVTLEFAPDGRYRTGLLIGAGAILALLVLTAIPVRRRRPYEGLAGGRWVGVALIALLVALGGMVTLVAVLACLLLRQLSTLATKVLALGGMLVATGFAVAGRLAGEGQSGAYGPWAQGALLVSAAAIAAASIDWFGTDGDARRRWDADKEEDKEEAPGVGEAPGA